MKPNNRTNTAVVVTAAIAAAFGAAGCRPEAPLPKMSNAGEYCVQNPAGKWEIHANVGGADVTGKTFDEAHIFASKPFNEAINAHGSALVVKKNEKTGNPEFCGVFGKNDQGILELHKYYPVKQPQ